MYGILISFGVLVSVLYAEQAAKKLNLNLKTFWSLVWRSILWGLIGARAYHVVDKWHYYKVNPLLILDFKNGGMAIYGALIAGVIFVILFLKTREEKVLPWLDILGLVLPLGQSIGRWGNFFNRELYGLPTNLAWGIFIPPDKRFDQYKLYDVYHPLFLYESILNLLTFGILVYIFNRVYSHQGRWAKPKRYQPGFVFFTYLLCYGTVRLFLEFFRINPWHIYGVNVAQFVSGIIIFVAIYFLFKLKSKSYTY